MGISLSAIGRWVRAERGPVAAASENNPVLNLNGQSELLRLRKENEQLQMERDILKKAAVDSMGQLGLEVRYPKRFKVTTDSDHSEAISANKLNREFDEAKPVSTNFIT